MANFNTHLTVAAVASGALATAFLGAQIVKPQDVVLLSLVGTVGGMLPDIDSDKSTPVKLMFSTLAIIFGFMVMFAKAAHFSIVELWVAWGIGYALVRHVAFEVFKNLTVHRGIFHSIIAGLFFWFFATALCYHLFDFTKFLSWTIGFFVFFGFTVHLCLDEVYSVDLLNRRIKRSLGTALKTHDYNNLKTSGYMAGAMLLMFMFTPSSDGFGQVFFNSKTYLNIWHNLLPHGMWFSG
jgi:LexA-binding, inner membrane-associated putative hydrolase